MPAVDVERKGMPAALIRLAGNEGVGEHVRTKFRTGKRSGETAVPP